MIERQAIRFYEILDLLAAKCGGPRILGAADGRMDWPRRGVYFFFEPDEVRSGTGVGPRVVRVGTHALRAGSQSRLWARLSQHRGSLRGGNHRGSVFRLHIGLALQARDPGLAVATWAKGSSATHEVVEAERSLEALVSTVIASMQVTWLPINDEPGPASLRGFIERNSIALLSAFTSPAIDPPSPKWLGLHCPNVRVRASGLWNSNHVDEVVDPGFLDVFERLVGGVDVATSQSVSSPNANIAAVPDEYGSEERIVDPLQRDPKPDEIVSGRGNVATERKVNIVDAHLKRRGLLQRLFGGLGGFVRGMITASARDADSPRAEKIIGVHYGTGGVGSKEEDEILVPRVDDSSGPTLVIIPCSGRKASGSKICDASDTLLDALPEDLAIRLVAARKAVVAAAQVEETTLLPAWRRYAGGLYGSAFGGDDDAKGKPPFKHLLILSGAYGVVRATDPIGTYDFAMNERRWPRGLLSEVIEAYALRHGIRRVIAVVSATTDYAKIIQRVDWARAGVEDAVLVTPEAAEGAMVKAPRAIGEALRMLNSKGLLVSWRSSDGLKMAARHFLSRGASQTSLARKTEVASPASPGKRSTPNEDLVSLTSPNRFRVGSGPTWTDYAGALKILDEVWRQRRFRNTSFGVLGSRPSWEDTINRAAPLFDMESWAELDAEQASMIAPTHFFEDGNALLGSVGRRSTDVRYFLGDRRASDDRDRVLSILKQARDLSDPSISLVGADMFARLCDVRGVGRSFATRLLTLARPDGFVVVNNKSADWLRAASGLALAGQERSYRELLRWLDGQSWRRCAEPEDASERKMWRIRTALICAFAYQPWL